MAEGLFLATLDKYKETTYLFSKPLHNFSFLANYTSYFLQQQQHLLNFKLFCTVCKQECRLDSKNNTVLCHERFKHLCQKRYGSHLAVLGLSHKHSREVLECNNVYGILVIKTQNCTHYL